MVPFATLFLLLLLAVTAARLWLAARQIGHLRDHRGRVPAPFRERVSPEEQARAALYQIARTRLGMMEAVTGALLLVVLTWGGAVAELVELGRSLPGPGLAGGTAALVGLAAVLGLADLPFAAWRTFCIETRYGFNRTTPALFLRDGLKQAAVGGFLIALPGAAFLGLMAGAGRFWWLWAWVLWLGFSLTLTWAYPKWIAPLFNRFRPLEDPDLRARVAELLGRCGFALKGVFVMDASRRTAHGNAYFTGLGGAKRVVFFDTLLDSLEPDETEAVLAHELGHFRLGHIRAGLAVSAGVALGGLGLLAWLRTQPWFYAGLGVAVPSDAAALALFALVAPVFAFPLRPLAAAWSRRREAAADQFAAKNSSGRALAGALLKLYRDNAAALTADPVYSRVYHSHPLPAERIARLEGMRS